MNGLIEIVNTVAERWAAGMWPILWQSTILAGIVFVLCRFLRRAPAALRYWLWMFVALRLVVMPFITVSLPLLPAPSAEVPETTAMSEPVLPPPAVDFGVSAESMAEQTTEVASSPIATPPESRITRPNVWSWLLMLWLAGTLFFTVRLAAGWRRIGRLASQGGVLQDGGILEAASEAGRRIGLRKLPRIVLTDTDHPPCVFGVLRPVVILPQTLVAGASPEELRALLAHEFTHLRRRDPLFGWVVALCEIFYFFHPVVYLVSRQLTLERERACDDRVLAGGETERSTYARVLLSAVEATRAARVQISPAVVPLETFRSLKIRLTEVAQGLRRPARLTKVMVAALLVAGCASLPGVVLTMRATADQDHEREESLDRTEFPARIVDFPEDHSIGWLSVRDAGEEGFLGWERLAKAQGMVEVPAGKDLRLEMEGAAVKDLSAVARFVPGDLQYLSLMSEDLNDEDLVSVKGMSGLRSLALGSDTFATCQLTGDGLKDLKTLTSLRELRLWRLSMDDEGLAALRELKSLERLYIANSERINGTGFIYLESLPSLHWLAFFTTPITDEGMAAIKQLSSLESLHLQYTEVTDEGLLHLKSLPNLREVTLPPQTTDEGLAGLAGIESLESIHLSDTAVSDAGLASLKSFPALKSLEIFSNDPNLKGSGLVHLKEIPTLEEIFIHVSRMTDLEIPHLKELKGVKYLSLERSGVTDAGLTHIAGLTLVETLDLGRTKITDAGLAALEEMDSLTNLAIQGTAVSDRGMARLSGLESLEVLRLHDTNVGDAGLAHLSGLHGIEMLALSSTKITNRGLSWLSGMGSLRRLYLNGTAINDAGLAHLVHMTSLKRLSLDGTGVTEKGLLKIQEALPNCEISPKPPPVPLAGSEMKPAGVPSAESSILAGRATGEATSPGAESAVEETVPKITYAGVVKDPLGKPLEGVTVLSYFEDYKNLLALLNNRPEATAVTGRDGRFALDPLEETDGMDSDRALIFSHPDYAIGWLRPDWQTVRDRPGFDIGNISVTLREAATVEGMVRNEEGGPVSDATVSAAVRIRSEGGGENGFYFGEPYGLAAKTNEAGRFVIPRVPVRAFLTLVVHHPDYVTLQGDKEQESNAHLIRAGDRDIAITLERGSRIEGQLLLNGKPFEIPGIAVLASWGERGIAGVGFSDGRGCFVITGLREGTYTITVRGGPLTELGVVAIPRTGIPVGNTLSTGRVTIELTNQREVKGRILNEETGEPVAEEGKGVWVFLRDDREMDLAHTVTDASGEFTLRLAPGEYQVIAYGWKDGTRSEVSRHLSVKAEQELPRLDIPIPVRPLIRGRLVNLDGRPVRGWVGIDSPDSRSQTGPDGAFSVPEPLGDPRHLEIGLAFSADGKRGRIFFWNEDTGYENLEFTLEPVARVSGRIIDEASAPVPDAEISLRVSPPDTGGWRGFGRGILDVSLNEDGTFVIEKVPVGLPLSLSVQKPGAAAYCELPEIKPGEETAAGDIVLKKWIDAPVEKWTARIAGRVLDENNNPIPGAEVRLSVHSEDWSEMTDRKGRFILEGLPPDTEGNVLVSFPKYNNGWFRGVKTDQDDLELQIFPRAWKLIGKEAPELEIEKWINSEPVLLASLRGKVVLLDIGGHINSYSRYLSPVQEAHRKYRDRGLVVIGVHRESGDVTAEQIAEFVEQHGIEFPFALDNGQTYEAYDTTVSPTRILIDKEGKVRRNVPWNNIDKPIAELLAE